jgi:Asp-tRNA(Asn)/Glu-tRNA(Gln) amidotransferase A subunit family amidase
LEKYNSLSSIQEDLSQGVTSCEKLVGHYLAVIEEKRHLNAFLEVYGEEALKLAKAVDEKIKNKIRLVSRNLVLSSVFMFPPFNFILKFSGS